MNVLPSGLARTSRKGPKTGPILLLALIFAASFVPSARAQSSPVGPGTRHDGTVLDVNGHPILSASVAVCLQPANVALVPCSPLAQLYTDDTLTVAAPNPMFTDNLGNYHFYAAPGRYTIQYVRAGIVLYVQTDVALPPEAGGSLTPGNCLQATSSGLIGTTSNPCGSGGGGGGTNVSVNGASVATPNFNSSAPAAASGFTNLAWQSSGSNVSAEFPNPFYQTLESGGVALTERPAFNLIGGTNVTVTCADNSGALRTDCTFSSSGGGGGGGSPGGSSGNIEWDNAGAFAGIAGTTVTAGGAISQSPSDTANPSYQLNCPSGITAAYCWQISVNGAFAIGVTPTGNFSLAGTDFDLGTSATTQNAMFRIHGGQTTNSPGCAELLNDADTIFSYLCASSTTGHPMIASAPQTTENVALFPILSPGLDLQTGTSYTIPSTDYENWLIASNAAAMNYTLPQAGGGSSLTTEAGFGAGWFFYAQVPPTSAGALTITPTTSTINAAASLTLPPGSSAIIVSDGANYRAIPIFSPLAATTGSIGGSALTAGQCASGTASVPGAATSMSVTASPTTYPGDGFIFEGYVSAAGTVTVKVCAEIAGTPAASAYNVRVIP